jgi:GntR family transcriptional regulator
LTALSQLYILYRYSETDVILLSEMSPLPLREQIVRQIRQLVLSGRWDEHAQLPSIRGLAREQRVSVVTVQNAFEQLEQERLVYARHGKGYFVAPITPETRKSHARDLALRMLAGPVREAVAMGLGTAEIEGLLKNLLEEEGGAT